MKPQPSFHLAHFLKGMSMGIAEVIPGVSGGTLAFITGIYERLLAAIKTLLSPAPLQLWQEGGLRGLWRGVDGNFLLALFAGMATGLVVGVFGITYLLEHYPPAVWAFFFGLILASILYIARQINHWTWAIGLFLAAGAALAYWLTVASPLQGSSSLLAVFFSGVIAICALVLPGISGSFVLLLLGMYTLVLPAVKSVLTQLDTASLAIVGVFAAGCLTGLAAFSRLLSWTLERYHQPTMALLTGFMLGSLNKLWPWRNVLEHRVNSRGELVPFRETNVWPGLYTGEPLVWAVILAALGGFILVFALDRWSNNRA